MNIVVSGCSGLVGTKLLDTLQDGGYAVTKLVRRAAGSGEVEWQPSEGRLDAKVFDGCDGVIHLGGDNIAVGRWNAAKKQRIRDSRIVTTGLLAETMAKATQPPKFFVCASAIGYYGSRGDEVMTESSSPGDDFLAGVCKEWEAAAQPARDAGIRVVNTRIGVVLAKHGGALHKMLTPFKMCVGGIVGNGRQYWSSVALSELVKIIAFCAENDSLSGPVNAVNPIACTNHEFTKTLGRVLGRPTVFPLPGFVAKIMLGEMADALLLSSTRVEPEKLAAAGYEFMFSDLESALRHELS